MKKTIERSDLVAEVDLLTRRIKGLTKEMDRVKSKQKETYEFYGNVRHFEYRVRNWKPLTPEEETNSELFSVSEMAKYACESYDKEYKQLFETYQLCLKELHTLERNKNDG